MTRPGRGWRTLPARGLLVLALAVAFVPAAHAGVSSPTTAPGGSGVPAVGATAPRLTTARARDFFLADPKVAAWLERYPPGVVTSATYASGIWTVDVFYGAAGEIATGMVEDATGAVVQAWTGPQVAWSMARGSPGAFGGTLINSTVVWLSFCAVFLIGLADWRRPLSLRNLDLLVLVSFSLSLWYFNHGNVFAAMPLVYPAFAWLIVRCLWIAGCDRPPRGGAVWPTWVLIAATVFLVGFRFNLNVYHSNVIDVGLSGVIGAERIAHFQDPYGNFPIEGTRPDCGPADASGEVRDRIQTNGRCEAADPQGDTYGPVSYEAYLPGYLIFGWSGRWDTLPAAHATSILWDLLCILGLWLVGRRFGGQRLGATLAFAWAAWPFTQYASNSNTNDMIQPALLVWGFLFATSHFKRGVFSALSAWTKFAPLILVPLWSGFPDGRALRPRLRFAAGFAAASAVAFVVLLFDGSPVHDARVFFHDTFTYQFGRDSPFSLWDWAQYHARGLPDLRWVQRALQVALALGALALVRWPARRSPLRLAAFTGALLVGFEAVLTHWSYLYLPWFFPFVCVALLAPQPTGAEAGLPADAWPLRVRALRQRWATRRMRLVGVAVAVAVFLGSWEAIHHWFYANPQIIDTPVYQAYGTNITHGLLPYRDFSVEYPPGALAAFVTPSLIGGGYRATFGWVMAACGVLCLILVALARPPGVAVPFLAVSPLLLGSLVLTRFDLWPTLFVAAAAAAFVRDRHRLGWMALAAAFAVKLFAAVLLPLAVVWTVKRRGFRELARCAGLALGVLAASFGPFLALAPHGLWKSLWGELSRPLQIETIAGSFLETFGHPRVVASHGSLNLSGHADLGVASSIALGAALLALWVSFARGPAEPSRFVRYAAACVCAFVAFGKVLSPQFVIWLVPLVPLTRGRRGLAATGILFAILLDMLVWFPNRYYAYVYQGHLAWLVFGRDLLLVALLAVLSLPAIEAPRRLRRAWGAPAGEGPSAGEGRARPLEPGPGDPGVALGAPDLAAPAS